MYRNRGDWVEHILAECDAPDLAYQHWMDRDVAFARWIEERTTSLKLPLLEVSGQRSIAENAKRVAKSLGLDMEIPTITTSRLILRPFAEADVIAMHDILSGTDVLRYFPNPEPPSLQRVEQIITNQLSHWDQFSYGLWAITSHLTGQLMGRCGLQHLPDTNEVEIDFILDRQFWGQGFATEAGQAALKYGFETMGFSLIIGIAHVENQASQRVLEKLGLVLNSRATYFGMDCHKYALERSAYHAP
jgi:ribosomal-protein-alanine N-acetyltransferase